MITSERESKNQENHIIRLRNKEEQIEALKEIAISSDNEGEMAVRVLAQYKNDAIPALNEVIKNTSSKARKVQAIDALRMIEGGETGSGWAYLPS